MTTEGPNISNQSGPRKWYVDAEKCFSFWGRNRMDCSTCIRVCPYNKPPGLIHRVVRRTIRKTPRLNRAFVWADDLLGYHKPARAARFWESGRLSGP